MSGWEKQWSANGGLPVGAAFDAAQVEPALQDLIDLGVLPIGETLVPGCGRGYAVAALAEGGQRHVLGIDIAPTAVKAARAFLHEGGHNGEVIEADFFESFPSERENFFSLGYDCTFLCAIPPEMRAAWAKAWHKLLKPGGELVTLVFPLRPGGPDPADSEPGSGPPFTLSLKLVRNLLEPLGFELIEAKDVAPDKVARGARCPHEIIARWMRR